MRKEVIVVSIIAIALLASIPLLTGYAIFNPTADYGDIVKISYTEYATQSGVTYLIKTTNETLAKQSNLTVLPPQYRFLSKNASSLIMDKKIDEAIIGMKVGETREISLKPEEAYGVWNKSLVMNVNKSLINGEPKIGQFVDFNGYVGVIRYVNENDTNVYIDFNNPLVDKYITVKITLEGIWKKI